MFVGAGVLETRVDSQSRHNVGRLPQDQVIERIESAIQRRYVNRDRAGKRGAGGRAVAYRAGGPVISRGQVASRAPSARLFRTGVLGLEPTLGITPDGVVLAQGGRRQPTFASVVMRSADLGRTWQDVSPRTAAGLYEHSWTQDPYLYVDPDTGRVFTSDLQFPAPGQLLSFSDNRGASWTTTVAGADETDHQNVFAGPVPDKAAKPQGYPNVVYDCAINGGAVHSFSTMTTCDKSLDGGSTWRLTGAPAYPPRTGDGPAFGGLACNGATGHGFVGHLGTVYLPRGWCGQPWLAISHDEGASWKRVQVAKNGMNAGEIGPDHEAGVVADRDGNLYYVWVAHNYLPYLAVSRDGGKTWSEPKMVAPPGLRQAALPGIAIGARRTVGKIAIVYMGSPDAPRDPYPRTDERYKDASWNAYITMTTEALDQNPVFYTASINNPDSPLVRGRCGPVRCLAEFDFIDVQIGPDGTPWASASDACFEGSECARLGELVVGRLVGGPSLR